MFIFLGSTVVGAVEFEFRDVYAGVGLGVRLQNCSQGLRLLCGFRASGLDGLVLLYYHPAKPLNDVSLVTEIGKAWTLKHYTVLLYYIGFPNPGIVIFSFLPHGISWPSAWSCAHIDVVPGNQTFIGSLRGVGVGGVGGLNAHNKA